MWKILYYIMAPVLAFNLRKKNNFHILTKISLEDEWITKPLNETFRDQPYKHYGDPFARICDDDEANATINGVSGSICAPGCTLNSCPRDMPLHVNATPTCNIINYGTGMMYCSLACNSNSSCGHNATCNFIEGVYFCTYNK